jgi:ribonucleotide monophosphatase NagD (HAD superfamily)
MRSVVRQQIGRTLRPVTRHIPALRAAAELISRSPGAGLRLLLDSRSTSSTPEIQSQPDVYPFAAYLAQQFECTHVIAIGTPNAKDLIKIYPQFEILGVVREAEVDWYRNRYGFGTWLGRSRGDAGAISLPENILKRAVIVCTDAEQFANPDALFQNLKAWLDHAPVCILTTADRTLNEHSIVSGNGSGATVSRPDKWNVRELERLLQAEGFNLEFIGLTASDNSGYEKKTVLAVISNNAAPQPNTMKAPADFRVVAFMAAYNEADIIVQSIRKWTDQGVSVHVLENWSTDATYELAKELEGLLAVTVERFPQSGPSPHFDWGAMLARMEVLSREIEADWFVRRGADEVLQSPWPGVSYRDGLHLVDQAGFNCVDHTILEFHPVDDGFEAGRDHEAYFKHFDFKHLSHRFQRKAWKNLGQPISTIPSAGHDVLFAGRRVYPFKFLLKHYSFRSQRHGEKKVFRERKARWNPRERGRGWHIHYDAMQEGHRFVQSPTEKECFEESQFNETYLVERLSGIGVDRQ